MTKSDIVRKLIVEILRKDENIIQQKDLINEIMSISESENLGITRGVIRGVLNKIDGIGGIFIPVEYVESIKTKKGAYYKFNPQFTKEYLEFNYREKNNDPEEFKKYVSLEIDKLLRNIEKNFNMTEIIFEKDNMLVLDFLKRAQDISKNR